MIALLSTAIAATVTVCFTAEIDLDDVDLGTEDYFTANTDRELRGIEFQYGVVGGGFSAAAFADNNGCATLNVLLNTAYSFKVRTIASVNGRDIEVRQAFTNQPWQGTVTRSFTLPGVTYSLLMNQGAPNRGWNVLAVSSFALHRETGGIAGYDVNFYLTNGSGQLPSAPCGGQSCVVGTSIYLLDDEANRKFAITYAMGRSFLNHLGLASTDVDSSLTNTWCGPTTQALALHSLEHDSASAVAAYAWFYSATVFNETDEECGLVNRIATDWDMKDSICYDGVESPADHPLSCATGPKLAQANNQRAYCEQRHEGNDPAASTTVPLDWLRFLWALQSSGLEDFNLITGYYSAAINDTDWAPTGGGVIKAFVDAGLLTNVPNPTLASQPNQVLAIHHGVMP